MKTLATAIIGLGLASIAGPQDTKLILKPYGTNQLMLVVLSPGVVQRMDARSTGNTNWDFFFECSRVPNYVIIPKDSTNGAVLYRWISKD